MNCMSPMEDGGNVDEIIALMKARGGGFALDGAEDCIFPHYGPVIIGAGRLGDSRVVASYVGCGYAILE